MTYIFSPPFLFDSNITYNTSGFIPHTYESARCFSCCRLQRCRLLCSFPSRHEVFSKSRLTAQATASFNLALYRILLVYHHVLSAKAMLARQI